MAVVILPPGNKFKILSAYETIQLGEVLKASPNLKDSVRNLERKWREGEDTYDIDLISTTVTPLSELNDFNNGVEGELEKKKKMFAKEIQRKRLNYRGSRRPYVKKSKQEKKEFSLASSQSKAVKTEAKDLPAEEEVGASEESCVNVKNDKLQYDRVHPQWSQWDRLFQDPALHETICE